MQRALKLHPGSRCTAVTAINVGIARPGPGRFVLHYVATGRMEALRLPPTEASLRANELWRHTCFEAFAAAPSGAYHEFNFAPSTQWAAYRFDGYRNGMRDADMAPPDIEVRSEAARLELRATIDIGAASGLPMDAAWRIGLSAVIEDAGGDISYWALAHPPGRADFHHADSFALDLPAENPS